MLLAHVEWRAQVAKPYAACARAGALCACSVAATMTVLHVFMYVDVHGFEKAHHAFLNYIFLHRWVVRGVYFVEQDCIIENGK